MFTNLGPPRMDLCHSPLQDVVLSSTVLSTISVLNSYTLPINFDIFWQKDKRQVKDFHFHQIGTWHNFLIFQPQPPTTAIKTTKLWLPSGSISRPILRLNMALMSTSITKSSMNSFRCFRRQLPAGKHSIADALKWNAIQFSTIWFSHPLFPSLLRLSVVVASCDSTMLL